MIQPVSLLASTSNPWDADLADPLSKGRSTSTGTTTMPHTAFATITSLILRPDG
jgi:hypothetical protein